MGKSAGGLFRIQNRGGVGWDEVGGEKINRQKEVPWREERAKQGVRMTVLDDNEFILYVTLGKTVVNRQMDFDGG